MEMYENLLKNHDKDVWWQIQNIEHSSPRKKFWPKNHPVGVGLKYVFHVRQILLNSQFFMFSLCDIII